MYRKHIKHLSDIIIALVLIVVLSPVLLISLLVTAVYLRGNPLFFHPRPGLNEKIIKVIKLKTMKPEVTPSGRVLGNLERITPIGKFFRTTSIDEIPQLLNVLRGDLSMVGPRPLQVWYLPHYTLEQRVRHQVRPGITGLAQIKGRNRLSWDEKFEYDRIYVESLSFRMYIGILVKTFIYIFKIRDVDSGDSDTMEGFVKNPMHTDSKR